MISHLANGSKQTLTFRTTSKPSSSVSRVCLIIFSSARLWRAPTRMLKPALRFVIILLKCSPKCIILDHYFVECLMPTRASQRPQYGSHIIKLVSLQTSNNFAANMRRHRKPGMVPRHCSIKPKTAKKGRGLFKGTSSPRMNGSAISKFSIRSCNAGLLKSLKVYQCHIE